MKLTVNHLQNNREKLKRFSRVRIWSGQWQLWWRSNGAGYTPCKADAGIYEIDDAWGRVYHVGPEKKLVIEAVEEEEEA